MSKGDCISKALIVHVLCGAPEKKDSLAPFRSLLQSTPLRKTNTWEAEAGAPWVGGQPGLHNKTLSQKTRERGVGAVHRNLKSQTATNVTNLVCLALGNKLFVCLFPGDIFQILFFNPHVILVQIQRV
jgi:hypothetical protein